jgi:AmmeMemoRadiSam system protein A
MPEGVPEPARRELLLLARRAIRTYLQEGRRITRGEDFGQVAPTPRGAFVTLSGKDGELRGCIGTILPVGPLDETVVRMAIAAAVEDPRFHPVTPHELEGLHLEISALTVPEPVSDLEAIEVGRHGLIVTRGYSKGLLLPQVAPEWGWDRLQFLQHTCLKAGLPGDAWKDPKTRIEWFEAEVWGEEE